MPKKDPWPASGCDYDQFVNWEARLGRELPFFQALFEQNGVRRIVDAGCGSAKHAVAFAELGYDVAAFDPSESMLEAARANAEGAGVDLKLYEGYFADAAVIAREAFGEPADAVLTLGNGLPHVRGEAGASEAFQAFADALRPGGVLVLHLLNHERLIDKQIRTVPPKVRETPEGTKVFVRVLDYIDDGIVFDFTTLTRRPGALEGGGADAGEAAVDDWTLEARRSVHAALPARKLVPMLEGAGFDVVSLLGSHEGRALEPLQDESVIVVARRR